jgi:hypothetical protein
VRYVRQTENLGAARNFEFVAYESKGDLFAWCAHDDIRKPGFVGACVEELQRNPTAVACNCIVEFLDEQGQIRPNWVDRNFSTVGLTLPQRCLRLIDHMDWADIYGLIRRDALERVMPIDPVWGSDVVFTMKLLMLGDLCKVERPLFQYRVRSRPKPPQQTMQEVVDASYRVAQPYTALVRDLLAVPLNGVASAELREEIFIGFVRTYWELDPMRPHPCWRNILLREHEQELRGDIARPRFPLHLIRWLAEVVPGPVEGRRRRAFELVLRGARRALVAASAAPERDALARAWTRSLSRAYPRLAIHVLCPADHGPCHGARRPACAGARPGLLRPVAQASRARSAADRMRSGAELRPRPAAPDRAQAPDPGTAEAASRGHALHPPAAARRHAGGPARPAVASGCARLSRGSRAVPA